MLLKDSEIGRADFFVSMNRQFMCSMVENYNFAVQEESPWYEI